MNRVVQFGDDHAAVTILLIAVPLMVLDVIFYWWGHIDGWGGWAWPGWAVFVALGTLGLAAVTGALAWTTKSDVNATRDLAELGRDDKRARETPIVYAVFIRKPEDADIRTNEDQTNVFVAHARVRNVWARAGDQRLAPHAVQRRVRSRRQQRGSAGVLVDPVAR
jgi:hypothetical protein